jgi:uncharacterized membrane protein (DUF106 family)
MQQISVTALIRLRSPSSLKDTTAHVATTGPATHHSEIQVLYLLHEYASITNCTIIIWYFICLYTHSYIYSPVLARAKVQLAS